MDHLEGLFKNIERYVQLSKAEQDSLRSIVAIEKIKKRQYIVQPRFVCAHRFYIVQGVFRSYFIDSEGRDITLQLAIDDWFTGDFYSYITKTPATLFIEALEDSTILQMHYDDIEGLCATIPKIGEYFRLSTERAFAFSRRRVQANLSMTAEERYLNYVEDYPQIAGRVPQYTLASYLGITPEFLSKIKRQLSKKS